MSDRHSEHDLELSVRGRNIARHVGATTVRELVRFTDLELLETRCFGETSLMEIKEALAKRGLRLGMTPEEIRKHPNTQGKIAGLVQKSTPQPVHEDHDEEPCCGHCEAAGRKLRERTDLERKFWMSLAALELSVRATNCLEAEGITTVGDLVTRTADELLEVRNFSEVNLREVKLSLAQLGLHLGMPPHAP